MAKIGEKQFVLHVGLGAAASQFLENQTFSRLDPAEVCVNPKSIMEPLTEILRQGDWGREDYSASVVDRLHARIDQACGVITQSTILLSNKGMIGDPWRNYDSLPNISEMLRKVFPRAIVVLVLRNQIDWLAAHFKQTIGKGKFAHVDDFLHFRAERFLTRSEIVTGSLPGYWKQLSALDFDLSEVCENYARHFGAVNVKVVLFEDLVNRPGYFFSQLEAALGCRLGKMVSNNKENRKISDLSVIVTGLIRNIFLLRVTERVADATWEAMGSGESAAPVGSRSPYQWLKPVIHCAAKIGHLIGFFLANRLWRRLVRPLLPLLDRLFPVHVDVLGPKKRHLLQVHYAKLNQRLCVQFPDQTWSAYLYGTGENCCASESTSREPAQPESMVGTNKGAQPQ